MDVSIALEVKTARELEYALAPACAHVETRTDDHGEIELVLHGPVDVDLMDQVVRHARYLDPIFRKQEHYNWILACRMRPTPCEHGHRFVTEKKGEEYIYLY